MAKKVKHNDFSLRVMIPTSLRIKAGEIAEVYDDNNISQFIRRLIRQEIKRKKHK